jgi:hypothetical protein
MANVQENVVHYKIYFCKTYEPKFLTAKKITLNKYETLLHKYKIFIFLLILVRQINIRLVESKHLCPGIE